MARTKKAQQELRRELTEEEKAKPFFVPSLFCFYSMEELLAMYEANTLQDAMEDIEWYLMNTREGREFLHLDDKEEK